MKAFWIIIAAILISSCAGMQNQADQAAAEADTGVEAAAAEEAVQAADVNVTSAEESAGGGPTGTVGQNELLEGSGDTSVADTGAGENGSTTETLSAEPADAAPDETGGAVAGETGAAENVEEVSGEAAGTPDEIAPDEVAPDDSGVAPGDMVASGPADEMPEADQSGTLPGSGGSTEPPRLPDPLDGRQINRLIFTGIGEGLLPVHKSGSAVYLLHDIDGNGYSDVFALAVRVDHPEAAEFANINDYTRLYRGAHESMKFYLRLFYQKAGTLVPADLVSLGERLVVDSFSPQSIVEGKNSPFAVSIVFTTLQGRVREWVIFADGKPVRFSMQERTGELPRVEDIDNDGVIDVVIYEQTYEIGIGDETFMTWYRWNGTDFTKQAAINIVRNLQDFLQTAFEEIRNEDWGAFSEQALSSKMRGALPEEEYSDFSIFHRVFKLAAAEESFQNEPIQPGTAIRGTIYPEIRENPFSQRDSIGFFFPLSVRFETPAGRNHLYTTRVYMLPNPFGERQFTFAFEGDGDS